MDGVVDISLDVLWLRDAREIRYVVECGRASSALFLPFEDTPPFILKPSRALSSRNPLWLPGAYAPNMFFQNLKNMKTL